MIIIIIVDDWLYPNEFTELHPCIINALIQLHQNIKHIYNDNYQTL